MLRLLTVRVHWYDFMHIVMMRNFLNVLIELVEPVLIFFIFIS